MRRVDTATLTTPSLAARDQLDPRAPYALTIYLMSVLSLNRRQQRRVHAAFPSRRYAVSQGVGPITLTMQSQSREALVAE
jgi:hypothetical protein